MTQDLKKLTHLAVWGNPMAQTKLGLLYEFGSEEVERNTLTSFKWFCQAAFQGFAHAQYMIGYAFAYGEGIPKDERVAIHWFTKAAKQWHSHAQVELTCLFYNTHQFDKALFWAETAVDAGNAAAYPALGVLCLHRDAAKAVALFEASVSRNLPSGMFHLAGMYFTGAGGLEKSREKAIELYTLAANRGYPNAQAALGDIYKNCGDSSTSRSWYAKAAASGHAPAQFKMARIYKTEQNGRGVYEMCFKSAAQGYEPGLLALRQLQHSALRGFIRRFPRASKVLSDALANGSAKTLLAEWFPLEK